MSCDKYQSLGRHIYLTAQNIRNYAEKILAPYGMTLEQLHLLKNMPMDTGISQRELGALVNKSPANMTRILDRLESKSLILRMNNPMDRRCSRVVLTNAGNDLIQQVTGILASFSQSLTSGIDNGEMQATRAALDKIEANLQNMSQDLKTE